LRDRDPYRFVTRKRFVLVSVPPAVVTLIGPLLAPLSASSGTVAVICVSESTVKEAEMPSKVTAVAPVKFAPVIVTLVPACPTAGVKELMSGEGKAAVTVKVLELCAVPAAVVTLIGPVVAALGTAAVI
jgi:hypothetical protein